MRSCYAWILTGVLAVGTTACDGGTGPDPLEPRSLVVSPAQDTLAALGDTVQLRAELRDGAGAVLTGVAVEWVALDPAVATVDSVGRVIARGNGVARISATAGAGAAAVADTASVVVLAAASTADLQFVRLREDAPALATTDTSFWAVRGQDRELEIRFRSEEDEEDGDRFLEFRVRKDALLSAPDGRAFAEGDSVRIRVRVDTSGLFLFEMEPSGLQFDPERPAELRIHYGFADADELALEDSFYIWRRESEEDPWLRIATARLKDGDEVRAEITGFSAFSLAIP